MRCPNVACSQETPDHLRICAVCGADTGFPNVRAAEATAENSALQHRFTVAKKNALARGCISQFDEFVASVKTSVAVVSRPLAKVHELVSDDTQFYATFFGLVGALARSPENNEWDQGRGSVDSLLFPHYFEEIRFAALTLNDLGPSGYGGISIVLKDSAIQSRATVFEENSMMFCRKRGVVAGTSIPAGYRAAWKARSTLAAAKLEPRINKDTQVADHGNLLIDKSNSTTADFIEVHIFGPFNRRAISKITAKLPTRSADRILLKSIQSKAKLIGIRVEVLP